MSSILVSSPVRYGAQDALHHGQVFPVVVRLEQRDAEVKLEQYAAHGPHVARLRPPQLCTNYIIS